jgi:hypothetical protein
MWRGAGDVLRYPHLHQPVATALIGRRVARQRQLFSACPLYGSNPTAPVGAMNPTVSAPSLIHT